MTTLLLKIKMQVSLLISNMVTIDKYEPDNKKPFGHLQSFLRV